MNRIPSLDGLRAIAVSLVIFCHFGNDHRITDFFNSGDVGVRIFFVISGFLITGLLLKEFDTTGTINLSRFYFRRTMRIFPPFYVFLAAMLAWGAIGWNGLTLLGALPALTYTSNYWSIWDQSGYVTSHTWSLSTEEQFYLLWPPILWLSGRHRAPYILTALVLLSPILRAALYFRYGGPTSDLAAFHLNLDHIGMGCLLAFWRDRLHASAIYNRALASPLFVVVPVFILIATCQGNHPSIYRTLLLFLINVSIALCVDRVITHNDGPVGRELNRRWIVWIGTLSYSLYLWQQPFLHFHGEPPALTAGAGLFSRP